MLVGVMDKVGTFGFIRWTLPLLPKATHTFAPLVLSLAVVGIFYGALLAIGQRDLKRLVSYTSIAHFGFIAIGIFAFTSQGGTGATLYMVNHGFSTGALFLIVGFLIARRKSSAGRRLRRRPRGRARGWPGAFLRRRPVQPGAARAEQLRQRVPRAGRHVHPLPGVLRSSRPSASSSPRSTSCWCIQRTMHGPLNETNTGFHDLSAA